MSGRLTTGIVAVAAFLLGQVLHRKERPNLHEMNVHHDGEIVHQVAGAPGRVTSGKAVRKPAVATKPPSKPRAAKKASTSTAGNKTAAKRKTPKNASSSAATRAKFALIALGTWLITLVREFVHIAVPKTKTFLKELRKIIVAVSAAVVAFFAWLKTRSQQWVKSRRESRGGQSSHDRSAVYWGNRNGRRTSNMGSRLGMVAAIAVIAVCALIGASIIPSLAASLQNGNTNANPHYNDGGGNPTPTPTAASTGCPLLYRYDIDPVKDQPWAPPDQGGVVVRGWSNEYEPNAPPKEADVPYISFVMLYSSDVASRPKAVIGGSVWVFATDDCARADFNGQVSYVGPCQQMSVDGVKFDLTQPGAVLPHDFYPGYQSSYTTPDCSAATPTPIPTAASVSCPPGYPYNTFGVVRVPVKDVPWAPDVMGWVVDREWSNQFDPNWPSNVTEKEVVVLYGPGERPLAYVGGAFWAWEDEQCARADFAGQIAFTTADQPMDVNGMKIDLTMGGTFPSELLPPGGGTIMPSVPITPPGASQPPVAAECVNGTTTKHDPNANSYWSPPGTDGWRIWNVWSNAKGSDQVEHKLLLSPGTSVSVLGGGGDSTYWPASCSDFVQQSFAADGYPEISLAQLEARYKTQ